LQIPHLVHFSSSLFKRTPEIHLKGGKRLNNASNPPSGQILHHERLKKKAAIVTIPNISRLVEVKN
jgi:hypothetical protein